MDGVDVWAECGTGEGHKPNNKNRSLSMSLKRLEHWNGLMSTCRLGSDMNSCRME